MSHYNPQLSAAAIEARVRARRDEAERRRLAGRSSQRFAIRSDKRGSTRAAQRHLSPQRAK